MNKKWDYAELSKVAKEHGGPQNFLDEYGDSRYSEGYTDGEGDGLTKGLIGGLSIGGLFVFGVIICEKIKIYISSRREQKAIANTKAQAAKQEIIDAVEKYDAEHLDNEDADVDFE